MRARHGSGGCVEANLGDRRFPARAHHVASLPKRVNFEAPSRGSSSNPRHHSPPATATATVTEPKHTDPAVTLAMRRLNATVVPRSGLREGYGLSREAQGHRGRPQRRSRRAKRPSTRKQIPGFGALKGLRTGSPRSGFWLTAARGHLGKPPTPRAPPQRPGLTEDDIRGEASASSAPQRENKFPLLAPLRG